MSRFLKALNPEADLEQDTSHFDDDCDSGDAAHPCDAPAGQSGAKEFLNLFEERTSSTAASSRQGSRPNSTLLQGRPGSGGSGVSSAGRSGVGSRPPSSISRAPSSNASRPPTALAKMATSKNLNADNLKNLRRQPTMGADVMHLDDDKDFDPNEKDKDSDDEAHAGAKEGGEREAPGSKWDGPTASETLAAAEAENFNRHDEDRAKSNILKMREAAKAKVGALGVMGSKMDEKRVLRISNETLDFAIRQLASEDWRTRKVATYDFMDEVMTRTKASREAKDDEATKFYFEKVEKYVIPLFSDENWWVRKAAIRGVVKLSLDDPRAAQEAVVESIPHGDTYKGRWTACRAALRMYDAARSADKAEESMRINILHAMLELLDDDHWIVRQEVLNALDQFANFRDVHVISKALKILPHQEPKVRQTAVTILNQFIDPDGKHDSLSNKQVAQKMIDAGLTDQESFEALDDNGNGRLSAKELRAGLKDMLNVIFSVPRIKTFLGELANKDMRFEEFNTVVEKHHAEPAVTRPPVADFYAAKKALDKEGTATLYKDFRKNGKKMMMDLLNDLLNKLPVDYNLVPWVTSNLQVALRKERDWICKDRLFEGYVKMVQFHDPQLPFVLCELLLDKRNSGKLCNLVASQILEVADVMGDHYTAKGSIGIYCHEWMDMTDSPPTQETRGEEQKGNAGKQDGPVSKEGESSAAHAPDLKRCSSRRGRGRIEEGAWDICEVMVEKLYNPNVDMQLAAARCLVRFWDRGAQTRAMQAQADEKAAAVEKKQNFCNIAKTEYLDQIKSSTSMTRAGLNSALIRRKNPRKEETGKREMKQEAPVLQDHEFPAEVQAKIAAVHELRQEHEELEARVKASAQLDARVLDGLKNIRRSPNEELSELATQSLEIFLHDAPATKARRGLKNAVKMVQALQENLA